jgi:integrase
MIERGTEAMTAAGLKAFHGCRHTYASYMIAAGVNAKALCEFMGHSSISVTFDRYGKLMPGAQQEAAGLLDGFLARTAEADTGAATAPHPAQTCS